MIQDIFLLLIPLRLNMPVIKIPKNDVFYVLSDLNPQKPYGHDGMSPIILKSCASVLTPCLAKLFSLCLSKSTFLPVRNPSMYSLYLRRVIVLIPQTTVL